MNRQMKTSSEVAIKHLQVTPLLFSTLGETLATPFFFWDSGFSDARDWKINRTSNSNKAPFKIRSVWISKDHHGFTSWLGSKVTSWCQESDINSCWFLRFLPIEVFVCQTSLGLQNPMCGLYPPKPKMEQKQQYIQYETPKDMKQNKISQIQMKSGNKILSSYLLCVFAVFGHPPTCWDPSPSDLVEANRWRPLHDARPHTLSTWDLRFVEPKKMVGQKMEKERVEWLTWNNSGLLMSAWIHVFRIKAHVNIESGVTLKNYCDVQLKRNCTFDISSNISSLLSQLHQLWNWIHRRELVTGLATYSAKGANSNCRSPSFSLFFGILHYCTAIEHAPFHLRTRWLYMYI